MRKFLVSGLVCLGVLGAGPAPAQDVPDLETLTLYAEFETLRSASPSDALDIADQVLARADDPDMRLDFARTALAAGDPDRALAYIKRLKFGFEPADPRAADVLDIMTLAYTALGDDAAALEHALLAYNAVEKRLGAENPALLVRLDALEPMIRAQNPALMAEVRKMRRRIEKVQDTDASDGRIAGMRDLQEPTAVQVWYGTNRQPTGQADPALAFGTEIGALSVGTLTVTIPPNHLAGLIERPTGWFFTEQLDPTQHVVLAEMQTMTKDVFAQGCCDAEDRLLFIHGYNVSFHDGALRAAQLSYDLEFPGTSMYYSWPSKSSLYGYLSDANNVVASRPAMETFFEMATRGSGKLHVVAHSMGNRYALEALETFFLKYPDRTLGQLVLAAPDVDRAELAARFEGIRAHTDGVTLYASKHDLALQISRRVNGAARAGDANGTPLQLAGLDTVDASLVEADSLGHSYFADAPELLGDILGVVRLGWQPSERCGVAARTTASSTGSVWDVRPDGCPVQEVRTAGDMMRVHGQDALSQAQTRLQSAESADQSFWLGVMDVIKLRAAN